MNLIINSPERVAGSILKGMKKYLTGLIKGFHKHYPVTIVKAPEILSLFLFKYYLGLCLYKITIEPKDYFSWLLGSNLFE